MNLLCDVLETAIDNYDGCKKRWLIGIDWCRTEPIALELLAGMPESSVRIVDGSFIVGRRGCTPRLPWHPKVLILRGRGAIGVASGSGNLSRNGMTQGHEVGTAAVVSQPRSAVERHVRDECTQIASWFDRAWMSADRFSAVEREYRARFATTQEKPPVTDDDTLPGTRRRGLDLDRIQKLRSGSKLWIEAGNLHENLGAGQPGNQLMLSAMTRVFFGVGPEDVPNNTHLGYYNIRYGATLRTNCSLRYSDNSMDVLTLPLPGSEGPGSYDQRSPLLHKG